METNNLSWQPAPVFGHPQSKKVSPYVHVHKHLWDGGAGILLTHNTKRKAGRQFLMSISFSGVNNQEGHEDTLRREYYSHFCYSGQTIWAKLEPH